MSIDRRKVEARVADHIRSQEAIQRRTLDSVERQEIRKLHERMAGRAEQRNPR